LRYVIDPDRDKRVSRLNPQSEWAVNAVPALRIVPDDLWQTVKLRQQAARKLVGEGRTAVRGRRPIYLFSGLTKCAVCGGGYNLSSRDMLRCFNNEKRGTCTNSHTISRHEVERRIMRAMGERLFSKESFAAWAEGVRQQWNLERMDQRERLAATKGELARVQREIRGIIEAIKRGFHDDEMKAEYDGLRARKAALEAQLASTELPEPLLHPRMVDVWQQEMGKLASRLESDDPEVRETARSAIRDLISTIVIPADPAALLMLEGNLGKMLAMAASERDKVTLAAVAQAGCGGGI
jgi:site-specific DNA recombinase